DGEGLCVGCLANTDCLDAVMNHCDPATHSCRGCVLHSDCPSQACLPDGTCGDDGNVIYVDGAGADNATCTQGSPCLTILHAATLLTQTRRYMKLSGALPNPANVV